MSVNEAADKALIVGKAEIGEPRMAEADKMLDNLQALLLESLRMPDFGRLGGQRQLLR